MTRIRPDLFQHDNPPAQNGALHRRESTSQCESEYIVLSRPYHMIEQRIDIIAKEVREQYTDPLNLE